MNLKLDRVILVAAIVVPFGLVALGCWKAYELYKKRDKNGSTETK